LGAALLQCHQSSTIIIIIIIIIIGVVAVTL